MLLIVFACVMFPDTRVAPVPLRASAILKLALHPTFGLFLGTAALLAGSHAVLYAFGSLHWRAAGIDDRMIGLLWTERSEEHTSELQSLMRTSYAVFCLKIKTSHIQLTKQPRTTSQPAY